MPSRRAADREVREQRQGSPALAGAHRGQIRTDRPLGVEVESERGPGGRVETVATVFLAGAECPFACVFCDLWRFTTEEPTPEGAVPTQIRAALAELPEPVDRVKLYNASNFFDARAVPRGDDEEILRLLEEVPAVTVECHPRLIGGRCLSFAERAPFELEVAIGVETTHPAAHPRLNKGCSLEETWQATARLAEAGLPWRAFLLVGVPFVPLADQVEWVLQSAREAVAHGARVVSLIPVRSGNGSLERLAAEGLFEPPSTALLEEACDAVVGAGLDAAVQLDLWDIESHLECASCSVARRARWSRMNLGGRPEPAISCRECGS